MILGTRSPANFGIPLHQGRVIIPRDDRFDLAIRQRTEAARRGAQ